MFLSRYKNTRKSYENYEKALETLAYGLMFPQHFLFSQNFTQVETWYM